MGSNDTTKKALLGLGKLALVAKLGKARKKKHQSPLDDGLAHLNDRLGLYESTHHRTLRQDSPACEVAAAVDCARNIFYAPDMDGQVDPGEVVWFWAPTSDVDPSPLERALVVIGRHGPDILGLLTSPNPIHQREDSWLDIGAGPWDETGRQSWVRLDKVVKLPETSIRRQGAVIPQSRFERIANRLRADYGWA